MSKRCLITGGAGFAGHHVVEHLIKNTDWQIVVLDRLSYSSNGWNRLRDIDAYDDHRVLPLAGDFSNPISEGVAQEIGQVEFIIHMGAETHVDNSIINAEPFVRSNVLGTLHILEFARTQSNLKQFVYFSTDEVFGPVISGPGFSEWDRYNSTNPYAATKAGGEELALAFANTYGIPVLVTHTMNLYGERQHPEKFIPLVIRSVLDGEQVPIHASAEGKPGQRSYIHCRNMADALLFLLGARLKTVYPPGDDVPLFPRDKVNIVGEREIDNLVLAQMIALIIGKPLYYELVDYHSSRPGHDLRYALNGTRLASMGWSSPWKFEDSLEKTVQWMLDNPEWLGPETGPVKVQVKKEKVT